MAQEEIQTYNKLCAKFLGYQVLHKKFQQLWSTSSNEYEFVWEEGEIVCDKEGDEVQIYPDADPLTDLADLPFDSNWNWIMEVVERIEKLKFIIDISSDSCLIQSSDGEYSESSNRMVNCSHQIYLTEVSKKEAVITAIYQFLTWYNETTTTNSTTGG